MQRQRGVAHQVIFATQDIVVHTILFTLGILYLTPHGYGMWKNNALCRMTVHWSIVISIAYGYFTHNILLLVLSSLALSIAYITTLFFCVYFLCEKYTIRNERTTTTRSAKHNSYERVTHNGDDLFF
jgi:hypothetical protein